MPGARNAFTDDDDDLLVKFIAKYKPEVAGRKGNALYQMLTENEERKWSWSVRHPWQSWRERYTKRQDLFDAQIKRYQRKHAIKAENPVQVRRSRAPAVREEEEEDELSDDSNDKEVAYRKGKRKRARVSEGVNTKEKRRKLKDEGKLNMVEDADTGEGGSRDVDGGGKENGEALVEVHTLQEVDGEQTDADEEAEVGGEESEKDEDEEEDAEEGDSEDEDDRRGPVGSDDYSAELFQEDEEVDQLDEEPPNGDTSVDEEDGAADAVEAMLVDVDPVEYEGRVKITTHEEADKHQPLYPDITSIPSPHLHSAKFSGNGLAHIPGAYDASPSGLAQRASPLIKEDDNKVIKQDPTSPVSWHNSTTNATVHSSPLVPPKALDTYREGHNKKATPSSARPPPSRKKQPFVSSTNTTQQRVNGNTKIDHRIPKRKHLHPHSPGSEDSDFFDSIPPSPRDSASRAKATRQPPRILEGPFGNAFVGRKRWEDDGKESEDQKGEREQWPPVRRTRAPVVDNGKGKAKAREDEKIISKADREVQTENLELSGPKKRNIFPRQPQVNAVASSSRSIPNPEPSPDLLIRPTLNFTTTSSHHPFSQANEQPPLLLARYPHAHSKPTTRPRLDPINYQHDPVQGNGVGEVDLTSPVESSSRGIVTGKKTAKVDRRNTFREMRPVNAMSSVGIGNRNGTLTNHDEGQMPRSRSLRDVSGPLAGRDKKVMVQGFSSNNSYSHARGRVGEHRAMEPLRRIPTGSSEIAGPSTSRVPLFHQEKDSFSIPFSRPASVSSHNDPFVDHAFSHGKGKSKGKGKATEATDNFDNKRRHTIGGETAGPFIPKIDLRAESKWPRNRQSLPSQTHSNITRLLRSSSSRRSTPSATSPISVSANDRSLIERLGMLSAIELISRNHGFQEEVTWNVFRMTGSVTGTDKVMGLMRMKAEAVGIEQVARWADQQGTNEITDAMDQTAYREQSVVPVKNSTTSPPRRHSAKRGLQFAPAPVDDDLGSDYSPPKSSRAGQFARLVKQGRMKEALKREERRASGGGLLPPKIQMVAGTRSLEADRASSVTGEGQVEPGGWVATGNSDVIDLSEDWDVQEQSPDWGETENQMFMSASSGDEVALRELEAVLSADFIWQKMAYLISELICD